MEPVNSTFMQPIVNIGMLGSVSDGKSTTVYSLTGIKTQRHSNEMKRNITIKPGYANMKIYKNNNTYNTSSGELVHHVSFIDCPGHYMLIVTMMSCIRLMDGIILVVSAGEPIQNKPQLVQHIIAIKMSGIKNIIVLLNKLDIVTKQVAMVRYNELNIILNQYDIVPKCIIPVCMNHKIGTDELLTSIMKYMGSTTSKNTENPTFMISRSFDINHVNIPVNDMVGGVIGGSLTSGTFRVNDEIEIRPGISIDGVYKPIYTQITSLMSGDTVLENAVYGGLIGIGTDIDPYYCKNDGMVGMVAGLRGKLPPVYYDITMNYTSEYSFDDYIWVKMIGGKIVVISGTSSIDGTITSFDSNIISIKLSKPMCVDHTDMIILCDINNSFHIVAQGHMCSSNTMV